MQSNIAQTTLKLNILDQFEETMQFNIVGLFNAYIYKAITIEPKSSNLLIDISELPVGAYLLSPTSTNITPLKFLKIQ